METLKQRVRLGYSRSWVVEKYAKIGLWTSEESVCMKYFQPGERILDLGCGAGRTTIPLGRIGYRPVGVDISHPMVQRGRSLELPQGSPILWSVCDATELPFESESFDGILFSYNGIELVPGIGGKTRVIEESWRLLRPGGYFIFTTHAFEAFNRFLWFRIRNAIRFLIARLFRIPVEEREIGEVVYDPDQNIEVYYLQVISPRRYRRVLDEIGFSIVYCNSRKRIDRGLPPGRFTDFDSDFKFYVARKPPLG